jgi:hypothetical protein
MTVEQLMQLIHESTEDEKASARHDADMRNDFYYFIDELDEKTDIITAVFAVKQACKEYGYDINDVLCVIADIA